MFTGIVEEIGSVIRLEKSTDCCKLHIAAKKVLEDVHLGDSIAVNGVCLTVTDVSSEAFTADVMPETLRRSSLNELNRGSRVNLERAMAANGRFGGHIVAGHVDATGKISSMQKDGNAVWVTVDAPQAVLKYIVEKGSIAIDGISLTVAYVDASCFKVSVIPHTGGETTLLSKKAGNIVNLECDIIGKYVERLLQAPRSTQKEGNMAMDREQSGEGITREFLLRNGF